MSDQRFIIEMGMGNDQYGQDYTKAASRAIEDAFRHSAIPMFQALEPTLGLAPQEMRVQVTVGVQDPAQVDTAALVSTLPRGRAEVRAVFGGAFFNRGNYETCYETTRRCRRTGGLCCGTARRRHT